MKVLVMGGTGWVGHHIVQVFHDAGHDVTICSRGQKQTYVDGVPEGVARVQANKNDAAAMAEALSEGYDVVIDSVPTEESIDNVHAHAKRMKRYLHCSSTGGYAPLASVPGDETMPYDRFMGGWAQKGVVDSKVMDLCCRKGFPATVIRPSYITGPGMLPLDNLGGRREDFIPDILAGKPVDLPNDGQALLQPIHVADLAHMFLLAAEEPRSVGQIYNACLAKAVTISRYLEITAATFDRDVTINLMSVEDMLAKYGDAVSAVGLHFFATHMCYDISKPRDQLGYEPSLTTEEAIEETARWAADRLANT
ncbi:MAG: NAD-dependent epimerase/dehydratase family protein [Lentisphaerae bacterium]|nr:NAD-dependent epimerase/dehydratase family protein [Lentisphaerota bacterium]